MTDDDMRDRPGTLHNDGLSKRTEIGGVPFSDLAALNEDTRIMAIGRAAATKSVGFFVESDQEEQGKADRYIKKLKARFPELTISKHDTKSPAIVLIKVCGKISKADFLKG